MDPYDFSFQPQETTNSDFLPLNKISVGNFPLTLAAADFNQDGNPDVVVLNRYAAPPAPGEPADPSLPANLTLLHGDGTGTLTFFSEETIGTYPSKVLTGNFDGVNGQDIAVLEADATAVRVMLNDGAGGWLHTTYALPGLGSDFQVVDLNGTGGPEDLLLALPENETSSEPGGMLALINNSAGAFSLQFSALGVTSENNSPFQYIFQDLDGNLTGDVALLDRSGGATSGRFVVMKGDGAGNFTEFGTAIDLGPVVIELQMADFNSDGLPDVAISDKTRDAVTVATGDGTGVFTETETSPQTFGEEDKVTNQIVVGDFTPTGTDIVVIRRGKSDLSFLDGAGDSTFTPTDIPTTGDPYALLTADIEGDGNPDLIALENTFKVVNILSGDGAGGFNSTIIGFEFIPRAPVLADLTNNGLPDLLMINSTEDEIFVLINCHPTPGIACP